MIVLVGLLAGSQNADRAVLTGLRNFIRDIGGGMGITSRFPTQSFPSRSS